MICWMSEWIVSDLEDEYFFGLNSDIGTFTRRSNDMYKITKVGSAENTKGLETCTQGVWRPVERERDKQQSHWDCVERHWQVQNLLWRQRRSKESFGEKGTMIKFFKAGWNIKMFRAKKKPVVQRIFQSVNEREELGIRRAMSWEFPCSLRRVWSPFAQWTSKLKMTLRSLI